MNPWGFVSGTFHTFFLPEYAQDFFVIQHDVLFGVLYAHPSTPYLPYSQSVYSYTHQYDVMRDYGGNIARGLSYNDSYNNKKRSY